MFKQFVPTSAFGASLAQQHTGASTTSSQGQARGFPQQQQSQKAPMPSTMDDLLGDNDASAEESSRLTSETTELANMSNQIGNLRSQMETTQNKKQVTQADLNATSAQKRDLEQRLQQFRAQYETEVRSVKELEQQLAASRDSTKKLSQDLAMLEGTYQDLQTQHQSVSQQLQADQQENASLRQKIGQMNSEVARLKPEIEKMKLDARQQKGLVSINKKQLSTNESERDRLQTERADLERAASEQTPSAAASPEPFPGVARQASNMVSPAASTMSSTNPFFKKAGGEGSTVTSPAATAASTTGPTPSAFDALFGPSAAFAPTGQAVSRTGTPPATSFIGRSMPAASTAGAGIASAGAGAVAMAGSTSSPGEATPAATPPAGESAMRSASLETPVPFEQQPPPPPESRQFTPTNLPLGGGMVGAGSVSGSDAASSTKVVPPASRAGGTDSSAEAVGGQSAGSMPGTFSSFDEPDRETVPGAFPGDEAQPMTTSQEVAGPTDNAAQTGTPAASDLNDDFDSAFASFGQKDSAKEAQTDDDPFAPSSSQEPASSQPRGFNSEFPPIQSLDREVEDSDSDSGDEGGFDDDFSATAPQQNGSLAPTSAAVASGDDIAAARPQITSIESTASDLPGINKEISPPTYDQSDNAFHGGSGERSASNQFPPEFGGLLPSREDPTSPPPPATSPPVESSQTESTMADAQVPQDRPTLLPRTTYGSFSTPTTDVFVDAQSRPMSSIMGAGQEPQPAQSIWQPAQSSQPKNAFDDFDDFADLSEAKEADKSGNDVDFGFGRQSVEEFNPAFDSPGPSQTPTLANRSVQQSQDSNGFANFTPNASTTGAGPFGSESGSIQQTPQNVQHDWDAIFSGLDSSKDPVDTTFDNTTNDDPWTTGVNGGSSSAAPKNENLTPTATSPQPASKQMPELGRAVTPGTEHDDPILKRLTGMGYTRGDALNALEMYDYDINKAVDHLAGN
ncbi:hypothetical protein LTR37_018227 [Vermiconidia calcicola]|uniref:Uncharacterized protein n=1 Tax=Vermiconidia calcicola TaxID=1690605 RepID=A0ACC3MHR9_9PEZI|nr:hypothetical protein LTR37_018227 [Vermiconidia calcicola]